MSAAVTSSVPGHAARGQASLEGGSPAAFELETRPCGGRQEEPRQRLIWPVHPALRKCRELKQ